MAVMVGVVVVAVVVAVIIVVAFAGSVTEVAASEKDGEGNQG
tara:strand:+ start:289 stop:414 length:126 start_codon:yes stop_codon:yes gene_type:complete